jgi:hypothetical protein
MARPSFLHDLSALVGHLSVPERSAVANLLCMEQWYHPSEGHFSLSLDQASRFVTVAGRTASANHVVASVHRTLTTTDFDAVLQSALGARMYAHLIQSGFVHDDDHMDVDVEQEEEEDAPYAMDDGELSIWAAYETCPVSPFDLEHAQCQLDYELAAMKAPVLPEARYALPPLDWTDF